MSEGQSSPRAAALNQEITENVGGFAPSTSPEQTLSSQALQRTHEVNQDRTLRLLYASKGLPPILWFVLGFLAIMIIVFSYLLGMESVRLHILAVAALIAGLGLTMLTPIVLDRSYGGDLRGSPEALELG